MNLILIRSFSSTLQQCYKSKGSIMTKQINVMKKIMVGREKGKRRWILNENMPKLETAKNISNTHGQTKSQSKRVIVLNKLFMKNISDLMATDAYAKNILGYGLQITNVKMSQDFKAVNVFWLGKSDEKDIEIQEILNSIAGPIRHQLSQLRLMGEVPRIYFVRDHLYSKNIEIDSILKQCDFGDDFVPTDPTLFMRTEPSLEIKMSDELKMKISEVESQLDEEEEELPPMRHDIFGIDHEKMMNKIAANIDKTKRAWETFETKQTIGIDMENRDMTKISEDINRLNLEADARSEFAKFLSQKQYKKATPERKKHQNLCPDDFDDQEEHENHKFELEDDDYYVEDLNEKKD